VGSGNSNFVKPDGHKTYVYLDRPHIDSESEDIIFEGHGGGEGEGHGGEESESSYRHEKPVLPSAPIHKQFMYIQVSQLMNPTIHGLM